MLYMDLPSEYATHVYLSEAAHATIESKIKSRFNKLPHTLWCCRYYIVWMPKYRYRILIWFDECEIKNNPPARYQTRGFPKK